MKRWLKASAIAVIFGLCLQGCFGSFGLTRLLYNFNKNVHSNVFVQTLVMWCFTVIPAYPVVMWLDWMIINIIEFFMGSNPIGGNFEYVPGDDGTLTAVNENGDALKFTAVTENRMIVEKDGVVLGEISIDQDKNITMTNYANAEVQTIDANSMPNM